MREQDQKPSRPARKPREQSWHSWIEEIIQEAQERGDFDNLHGQGKPLPDRRNPYLPDDKQLAHDLIRNSGHTLPWIDDAKEIDRRIEAARGRLRAAHTRFREQRKQARAQDMAAVRATWDQDCARFEQEVIEINRLIDAYNLKTPSVQLHKFRLILAEEFERLE